MQLTFAGNYMAHILHIDTADDTLLVAVATDGKPVASQTSTESRNHASLINNAIDAVLAEAGLAIHQLSAIAVCGGPGSYTGLRIGMAAAKGLCYVHDVPLMVHNRLLLLTLPAIYKGQYSSYTAMLNARDKEYFIAAYNTRLEELVAPTHVVADNVSQITNSLGDGLLTIGDNLQEKDVISEGFKDVDILINHNIDISAWARYSYECEKLGQFVTLSTAEPFYLKQVFTHNSKKTN